MKNNYNLYVLSNNQDFRDLITGIFHQHNEVQCFLVDDNISEDVLMSFVKYSVVIIDFKENIHRVEKILSDCKERNSVVAFCNFDEQRLVDMKLYDNYNYCLIYENSSIYNIKNILKNGFNQIRQNLEINTYHAIFESSRDAQFTTDKYGKVIIWNKSAERIFGWSQEEMVSSVFYENIIPKQFLREFEMSFNNWVGSSKHQFTTKTIEFYGEKKNGDLFPIELSMAYYTTNDELYVAFFSRDITERINSKEEIDKLIEEMVISKEVIEQNAMELIGLNHDLYESQLQLKELNANKDKFFSIIAHDLKGPFQNLIGYTDILSKDTKFLTTDDVSELATNLHLSAVQLFKLLENLLNWSRIQRGAIEHSPEECHLYLIFKQNLDLIAPRTKEKNIAVFEDVEEDLSCFVDANMLNTVIRNLLSNSIKFTPDGGNIKIIAKIMNDEFISISISDSGVGIPPEKICKLFRIDESVSTPGTNNEQGTGLGLILCKELVEKNGGEIFVESEIGIGTTFQFTVPIFEA